MWTLTQTRNVRKVDFAPFSYFLCVITNYFTHVYKFAWIKILNSQANSNHAKKLSLNNGCSAKSSFRTSRAPLSEHQISQNFDNLYNILHNLTGLNQIMANFGAQVIFRVPFVNPFPTLKMIDFQIILMPDNLEVFVHLPARWFREYFPTLNSFLIHPVHVLVSWSLFCQIK